jgi:hypothetical protein
MSPGALTVSPQPAYVGSGQTVKLTATGYAVTWTITGSDGTIDAMGNFTAPTVTQNTTVTATSSTDSTIIASITVNIIAPASVTTTANPQVALYTISVPDENRYVPMDAIADFSTAKLPSSGFGHRNS